MKVGYIPEHFSTPILFAEKHGFFKNHSVDIELVPFPSGSGHLIQCLKSGEIDIAVGLTEAFVRGICNGDGDCYSISGTYVESPLCWSISTGANRDELISSADLNGKRIGVSRIGSGSYIMSFVLALQSQFKEPFFSSFPILQNFRNLRDSVNLKEGVEGSEAFMWEYFTSKKYYDSGEIKRIGEIYTPWSSWVVVASNKLDRGLLSSFQQSVQEGISYFEENKEEAVQYISTHLDYSKDDALEWLKTVKFSDDVTQIDFQKNLLNTAMILKTAGVIDKSEQGILESLSIYR